jgi:prepilin-type N-terminal cleavage/methylation domain-containing protein
MKCCRDRQVQRGSDVVLRGGAPLEWGLRRRQGYSLVEIMVAMTLLTVIVVGLMATLNQAQRALRASGAQTDTLENGRAFLSLLSREMQEMVQLPALVTNVYRFASVYRTDGRQLIQSIPGNAGLSRTNELQSFCFVVPSKESADWKVIFYDFREEAIKDRKVGALYRSERAFPRWKATNDLAALQVEFISWRYSAERNTNEFSKILDGVVHLRFQPYEVTNGFPVVPQNPDGRHPRGYYFANGQPPPLHYIPGAIEVELGLLDTDTYKRSKSIDSAAAIENFLNDRSGNVQLFRQRITISTRP